MALKRCTYTLPLAQMARRQRVGGRGGCDAAFGVSLGQAAPSADLGGSSKHSSEKEREIQISFVVKNLKTEVEKGSM